MLLFADDETALRLWTYETPAGPLVVYGPALLRSAELRGSTLHLTGDVTVETGVEVWGRGASQRSPGTARTCPPMSGAPAAV
ncbi:beta-galactosidase domain 3-containing protein [Streptomyces thermocarboxydus]